MRREDEINARAAEAMRCADNADAEECLAASPLLGSDAAQQQQQQWSETAAEAMRRADVAYTRDDEA
ncbi:hypothetical protein LSCM1_05119 [Leishmania martiniquensis]|uniref:Uncharacterized protein n=1 Tax=Leishmania martiniquensis TaxID=1580590 RepID=A0A836KLV3_9TRYP|nr:hypothetical protein LSCM1_05119 [Leishmania martiniquensis]